MILAIDVPYPPSINNYWLARGNRRFISKRGKEFRMAVAEIIAEKGVKLSGRLSLAVGLYPPDRRRRDIDNPLKALIDALMEAGAFDDDEQIDEITVQRRDILKGGRCTVILVEQSSES